MQTEHICLFPTKLALHNTNDALFDIKLNNTETPIQTLTLVRFQSFYQASSKVRLHISSFHYKVHCLLAGEGKIWLCGH